MDASVALRSIDAGDPRQPAALRAFVGAHALGEVTAPLLLLWEVGQVVHRKAPAAFGATSDARHRRMEALLRAVVLDAPSAPLEVMARTAQIADSQSLTVYDAAYVELAQRRGAVLLTDDDRMIKAATRILGAGQTFDSAGFANFLDSHADDSDGS